METNSVTKLASNGLATIKTPTDTSNGNLGNEATKLSTNVDEGRNNTMENGIETNGTTTNGKATNDPTANGVSHTNGTAERGSSSPDCPFKFTPVGSFRMKTPEEVIKYYDDWATTYDEWTKYCGYRGPEFITELVKKYCQTSELFLIVGVGTGECLFNNLVCRCTLFKRAKFLSSCCTFYPITSMKLAYLT